MSEYGRFRPVCIAWSKRNVCVKTQRIRPDCSNVISDICTCINNMYNTTTLQTFLALTVLRNTPSKQKQAQIAVVDIDERLFCKSYTYSAVVKMGEQATIGLGGQLNLTFLFVAANCF